MPVTPTKNKAPENAEIEETSENGKNSKNKDKNSGTIHVQVFCIQYFIIFYKQFMLVLLKSEIEINTIFPTFAKKLGLPIKQINIRAQKIYSTMLDTYEIVVIVFSVMDKANQVRYFKRSSGS